MAARGIVNESLSSYLLPRAVGSAVAKELVFTGRVRGTCAQIGLALCFACAQMVVVFVPLAGVYVPRRVPVCCVLVCSLARLLLPSLYLFSFLLSGFSSFRVCGSTTSVLV
jgi:hypothetical protein